MNCTDMNAVGKTLLAARKQARFSVRQLGKLLGVSGSYVSLVETGRTSPPRERLIEWARALGLAPESILGAVAQRRGEFVLPVTGHGRHDEVAAILSARWAALPTDVMDRLADVVGALPVPLVLPALVPPRTRPSGAREDCDLCGGPLPEYSGWGRPRRRHRGECPKVPQAEAAP